MFIHVYIFLLGKTHDFVHISMAMFNNKLLDITIEGKKMSLVRLRDFSSTRSLGLHGLVAAEHPFDLRGESWS